MRRVFRLGNGHANIPVSMDLILAPTLKPLEPSRKCHQFIELNPKHIYAPGIFQNALPSLWNCCQDYHHSSSAVMSSLSQTAITRFLNPSCRFDVNELRLAQRA